MPCTVGFASCGPEGPQPFADRLRRTVWAFVFVVAFVLSPWGPLPAAAAPFRLHVKSAILLNTADGQILYAQNPDLPIPPASITKIMTLYLAYEAVAAGRAHWTDRVRVSRKARYTGGSRMFLDENTSLTLGDLAAGTSIFSANDGAVAIAEYLAGSVEDFVKLMNRKARELGMNGTVFKNPHGLPAKGQTTTARDILKLSHSYLTTFPQALSIHSQQTYTYHNITQYNRNRLLRKYPGADGIKTGFIAKSGYNIAATAKRGDTRLIAVVLGAAPPAIRVRETTKLLDEGFSRINGLGKGG